MGVVTVLRVVCVQVMQYLYKGNTEELCVESADILELMAAANFFQLDGLLQYCEVSKYF